MTREPLDLVPETPSVAEALEIEVAKRAAKGAAMYPLIGCILVYMSDLGVSHTSASWLFVVALGLLAYARLRAAKRAFERQTKGAHHLLTLIVASQSAVWGTFVATIFHWYRFGSLAWFALALSAGFVAGGTSSLGIHSRLHQLFMAGMAVPMIYGILAVDWNAGLALAVAASTSIYWVFLLRDARQQVEAYMQLWHAQEELRIARDQARAADRAKSSFLAMMSHEIRTPMHAAVGSASMLLETTLDSEQRRYAHTIVHAGETLVGLINDILDLSRMQEHGLTLECSDFVLQHALAETMQMFEPLARRAGLSFELNATDSAQRLVHGDKRRLQQIMVNLIGNAIKFTEHGFVKLEADAQETDGAVLVRLSVADSGIGINPQQLQRIFQPFEQADFGVTRKYGGSGLGLAICKRLAEAMDGQIRVTSQVGSGTRFDVELRLQPGKAPADAVIDPMSVVPGSLRLRKPLKVLVVDDSALNRAVARQMLERLGCECTLCESGDAALALVQRQRFDVVLMDCQMRGLDGYETTRRLRALPLSQTELPVIAVTANAFEDDRKAALAAGMNDLLAKPFGLHDLEHLLIRWTQLPTTELPSASQPSTPAAASRSGHPSHTPDPGARLVSSATSMYPKALQNIALLLGVEVDTGSLDGPVSGFLHQWQQRHALMQEAFNHNDQAALRQVVHALEGGIPYFGSDQLNAALKELQKHSRAGDMPAAAQACEVLANLVDELTQSRDRHLSKSAQR